MGRYSSKKRKGTRKQSFKNRKRLKKGGSDGDENKDAPPTTTDATTTDNTDQNAADNAQAVEQQVDNTDQNAAAPTTTDNTDQNAAAPTTTDNTDQNAAAGDAQTGDAQTDANVNATGTEGENKKDDAENAPVEDANETGNEDAGQDWKEGLTQEAVEQAEQKVVDIEQQAKDSGGVLDKKTIDDLVNQLENTEGVPAWAKALARTGGEILKNNPALANKLTSMGLKIIENADVSGATVNTGAPGAPNAGTGAPGTNTGAAAPGGPYTADDAGYKKFLEDVQKDPGEILKKVVYVNDGMPPGQIFLKQNGTWTVPE